VSRIRVIIGFLGLLVSVVCGQSQADSLFGKANAVFAADKFSDASNLYESLIYTVEHADLYYNLGNAYFRQGEIGQSIWAYEKGLQFNPRDKDLQHNIAIARAHVRDRIEFPEGMFFVDYYRSLKQKVTLGDLFFLGGFFLLMTAAVWFGKLFGFIRGTAYRVLMLPSVIAVISLHLFMLDVYWDITGNQRAVVITPIVEALSAPAGTDDKILFRIHEGSVVELTQQLPGWVEIGLLDGKKGWIPDRTLRVL
jgi:hypothetical protein